MGQLYHSDLHWLPVRRRVEFKVVILKCAWFGAIIPHRRLRTGFLIVGSSALAVCRHMQVVRPSFWTSQFVPVFVPSFWTKPVEQPPNRTANDSECSYFSPGTEDIFV
jgi:hypothetical protein